MQALRNIRLDLLSDNRSLQQRPLDEETLSRYRALMADGSKFPPIEIISDGPNFWPWDGFHRIECARRQGQKTIRAYVTKGTLRDAVWKSFGANKDHGLPRQKGAAKKIIKQILTDKNWSKKSLSAIAKHVGTTRQYVTKIKDELSAHGATRLHDTEGQKSDSEPKNDEKGATSLHPLRNSKVEVMSSRGKVYEQISQEKKHKVAEPLQDMTGRVIPEHLRQAYEGRKILNGLIIELARIKRKINGHIDDRDSAVSLLNVTSFQVNCENLRRTLKSALPYAVCCYCGGENSENCKACRGFGLLNKDTFAAAPKDLKND